MDLPLEKKSILESLSNIGVYETTLTISPEINKLEISNSVKKWMEENKLADQYEFFLFKEVGKSKVDLSFYKKEGDLPDKKPLLSSFTQKIWSETKVIAGLISILILFTLYVRRKN